MTLLHKFPFHVLSLFTPDDKVIIWSLCRHAYNVLCTDGKRGLGVGLSRLEKERVTSGSLSLIVKRVTCRMRGERSSNGLLIVGLSVVCSLVKDDEMCVLFEFLPPFKTVPLCGDSLQNGSDSLLRLMIHPYFPFTYPHKIGSLSDRKHTHKEQIP